MRWHRVVTLAVCCMVLMLCISAPLQAAVIHKGIYIDNTDVAGMTQEEANSMVESRIADRYDATLTLTSPTGYEVKVHPAQLGMSWANTDIAKKAASYGTTGNILKRYMVAKDLERSNINYNLELNFDRDKLTAIIEENLDGFNQEAIDYELSKNDNGIMVKEGCPGIVVDEEAAVENALSFLKNDWDGKDAVIELTSHVDEPQGSVEGLTQITDVIGSFTTSYKKSGASRCSNVANGCRLINGSTVYPGEQFSVLEHLVPFTTQNGYELAGSYMNGLVVDTLGGGICQVSSTLYNAVLLAELQVDERQNHSMIVDYVDPSGDAAIAESSGKDFKFTNNKDFPIYIEGYVTDEKEITFNIYGVETRPANRKVSFRSEVLERTVADYESIIPDAGKPVGYLSLTSSHAGIKARYIKEVTVDGVVQSSEVINNSSYKMVPRTLVVGVGTDNAEAYNQLQEAIATGSIDQVRATAGYWAGQLAAQPAPQEQPAGDP